LESLGDSVVVLCTPPTTERDGGESARTLAETTVALATTMRPGAVILAGGATARLVCMALGVVDVVRALGVSSNP
jgi:hypothetical protein